MMGTEARSSPGPALRWSGSLLLAAAIPPQSALAEHQPAVSASTVEPVLAQVAPSVVPAGTLVALRVDENLSSRTSRRGDTFSLTLVNDIWSGNRLVVPAGTKGLGQVVHAAGKGFGGRAGELIVTARYLEIEGRRIVLRGFKLAAAGADNAETAAISTAMVPIAGVLITGTSATIRVGQLAQAKLAEPYRLQAPTLIVPPGSYSGRSEK